MASSLAVYILMTATDFTASNRSPKSLKVHFLNIGQGDAIYIQSPNRNSMLIDSGPQNEKVISEIQKFKNIFDRKINTLLITHADADHIGSMKKVTEDFEYQLFTHGGLKADTNLFKDLMSVVNAGDNKNKTIVLTAGMNIVLDQKNDIRFEVLFPDFDFQINRYKDCHRKVLEKEREITLKKKSKKSAAKVSSTKDSCLKFINTETNLNSIVGRLSYGSTSFMLTGDAPIEVEQFILSKYGTNNFRSDILKLGHHGSKTSTSLEFLKTLNPKFLIVSAGKDNRYGHPHKKVLDTIEEFRNLVSPLYVKILRTDIDGTITARSNGNAIWVER